VPEAGRFVQLKQTGNMSTGGTSIDRTDDIHPDNLAIARQAALAVALDVAGIDVICPDIPEQSIWAGSALPDANGDRVRVVLDEVEAARAGVELSAPGDLVVVLVDKSRRVWAELQRLQAMGRMQIEPLPGPRSAGLGFPTIALDSRRGQQVGDAVR
jgi:hypothetical protein